MESIRGKATSSFLKVVPPAYFAKKPEPKLPVAPVGRVVCGFVLEVAVCAAAFAVMVWIFATTLTKQTSIVDAPQDGSTCTTLQPKRGVVVYGTADSENAQYAGLTMHYPECVEYLTKRHDVCGDSNRYDHLALWGLSNPNNSQYYPPSAASGSQGYFSFTPTQTLGLSTQFKANSGASISFPKPDLSQTFVGTDTSWFVLNFAKKTAPDAFTAFSDVPVSTFLYDAKAQVVHNTDQTTAPQQDYDLSGPSPNTATTDVIGKADWKKAVGPEYNVSDLAINDGVYYGLRVGSSNFNTISGIALDGNGNMFVTETNLVRRIDINTFETTSLGTKASPAFQNLGGVAVDAAGTLVFVTDSAANQVRQIDVVSGDVTSLGENAYPPFNQPIGLAASVLPPMLPTQPNVITIYVADSSNNLIRSISTDGTVASLANDPNNMPNPPFNNPSGVAFDGVYVFVADSGNSLVRRIDSSGNVQSLGSGVSPAFNNPLGLAVIVSPVYGTDVYVADTGNGLVRRLEGGYTASNMGTSASPAFNRPSSLALDGQGNVFVGDSGSDLLRRIDAKKDAATRVLLSSKIFSWDTRNPNPSTSLALLPDSAQLSSRIGAQYVVDTAEWGCHSPYIKSGAYCTQLRHAEFNKETGLIFLELQTIPSASAPATGSNILFTNPSDPQSSSVDLYFGTFKDSKAHFFGAFQTPVGSIVLLTGTGSFSSSDWTRGFSTMPTSRYTTLVTEAGTSVIDVSKIPAVSGSMTQYLMLLLLKKGSYSMYTYDVFADTYITNAAAASTHYMLSYTWGVCNDEMTRGLVELTFTNDYTSVCKVLAPFRPSPWFL